MLDFLTNIFGKNINISEYDYPPNTPMYIRDGYNTCSLSWNDNHCVLLSPINSSQRLPTLKKQLKNFQKLCDYPCALGLDTLTSLQRRNLLEENIPFISASQQVYLPFWGVCFTEKIKQEIIPADKMAPGTQLVFLYLYYRPNATKVNQTQIANDLHISKATCTRAINDLKVSKLIDIDSEGKTNWIASRYEKEELLQQGYSRLSSPVEKYIYVQKSAEDFDFPKSGLLALSELSMVGANEQDGAAAVYKKNKASIPSDYIISEEEFHDFGGDIIEVWSYDPALFAQGGRVDEISLLLSLEHSRNERIQIGLDSIRKNMDYQLRRMTCDNRNRYF